MNINTRVFTSHPSVIIKSKCIININFLKLVITQVDLIV